MADSESRGQLVSIRAGIRKVFKFNPLDSNARQQALNDRNKFNTETDAATTARCQQLLGRRPNAHEIQGGLKLPKTGTQAEQIRAADNADVVTGGPKVDPNRNYSAERVDHLTAQLDVTPDFKRPPLLRRIAQARIEAEKFDRAQQARLAREAIENSPDVKDALAHGSAWTARLITSHDSGQQGFLETIQKAQERLKLTGDTSEYWRVSDQMEADRKQLLIDRAQVLDSRAAEAREAAEEVRAELSNQPAVEQTT